MPQNKTTPLLPIPRQKFQLHLEVFTVFKKCFAYILADPPNDVLQNPG